MRPWRDATEYARIVGYTDVPPYASMRPWRDATEYARIVGYTDVPPYAS